MQVLQLPAVYVHRLKQNMFQVVLSKLSLCFALSLGVQRSVLETSDSKLQWTGMLHWYHQQGHTCLTFLYVGFPHNISSTQKGNFICLYSFAYNITKTCICFNKIWVKGNTINLYFPISADVGADNKYVYNIFSSCVPSFILMPKHIFNFASTVSIPFGFDWVTPWSCMNPKTYFPAAQLNRSLIKIIYRF